PHCFPFKKSMQGQQRNLCRWDENKSAAELHIAIRSVIYLPRKQKWGETKEGQKKCKPNSFLAVSAFKKEVDCNFVPPNTL
ncbi:hypothetical protein CDAR_247611, partial [Caerostris darwini]